jgi:ribosomal protein S20
MTTGPETPSSAREVAALVAELEQAEAYEQRLRQMIANARDQLAAGNIAMALSLLNAALSDIDSAADVVASTRSTGPAK